MNKIPYALVLIMALFLILGEGCQRKDAKKKSSTEVAGPLRITATTSIVGDIVSQVVDKNTEVRILIPPGTTPHAWMATPRKLVALESNHIVFINGFDLEGPLLSILDNLQGPRIVDLSLGITPIMAGHEDHETTTADPHLWLSPRNVMIWTQTIADALVSADPEGVEYYMQAAKHYTERLRELDDEINHLLADIPVENRKIVTDHNVLAYFARDYNFNVIGSIIPSFSDQAEPSAKHMTVLLERIDGEGVDAIFISETSSSGVRKLAESASQEGNRNLSVITLRSESLAPRGERGDDYIDFILHNVELIIDAL